jgi:hypothetical protein
MCGGDACIGDGRRATGRVHFLLALGGVSTDATMRKNEHG